MFLWQPHVPHLGGIWEKDTDMTSPCAERGGGTEGWGGGRESPLNGPHVIEAEVFIRHTPRQGANSLHTQAPCLNLVSGKKKKKSTAAWQLKEAEWGSLLINILQGVGGCSDVAAVRFPASSSVFFRLYISKNTLGDSLTGRRKQIVALYIWK